MSTTKDNEQLYREYPDLLGGSSSPEAEQQVDPKLLRLIRDLDAACAPSEPPAHLAASITQALAEYNVQRQQAANARVIAYNGRHAAVAATAAPTSPDPDVPKRARWTRLLPATRLGWAAVLLAVSLILSAGAYAVLPVLEQAFHIAGMDHIERENLGQQVDYRQTINGYTVVVRRVYADANNIIIGYVIENAGSDSGNVHPANEKLTNSHSTVFKAISGAGSGVQGGEAGYIATYDASVLGNSTETPESLNLNFTLDLVAFRSANETQPAPTAVQVGPDSWAVEAQPMREEKLAGPFTFSFSVPVTPGRIAEVHQTSQAAGLSITLERVVVTPSETRAYLRCSPPDNRSNLVWHPLVSLQVNGRVRGGQAPQWSRNLGDNAWSSSFFAPLYDEQGEWTITVNELVGMRDLNEIQFQDSSELAEALKQERLRGPWTFSFTAPPALQTGR